MDTSADDTVEEAPPGWVLNTPTRRREVWTMPALALVLAVLLALAGTALGDVLAIVVGWTAGVGVAVGAVALFVAGRRAYEDQTRGASWRFHVVRVVVGVGSAAVVMAATLVVGLPFAWVLGVVGGLPQAFRFARSVPRVDRLVVAWAFTGIAAVSAVLVVVRAVAPVWPEYRAVLWGVPAALFGVLAVVVAVAQFRAAGRAPLE